MNNVNIKTYREVNWSYPRFEQWPRLRCHIEENLEASRFNQTLNNVKTIQVEFNTVENDSGKLLWCN